MMTLNNAIKYARQFSANPAVLSVKRHSQGKLSVKRFSEDGVADVELIAEEPSEAEFDLITEVDDDVVVTSSAPDTTDEILIGINGGEVSEEELSDDGYTEDEPLEGDLVANCGEAPKQFSVKRRFQRVHTR